MDIETRLAEDLLEAHPVDAAQLVERLPALDVAGLLEKVETNVSAGVLQRMEPPLAAAVLAKLGAEKASAILAGMPLEVATLCLRKLEATAGEALVGAMPHPRARALRSLSRFPEGTAGSLMDPQVLALPHDLTAREALARVREAAGSARYNIYMVDREQVLVGVINVHELLLARPGDRLSELMKTQVHRLSARAGRHEIVSNPGWREVHALPVVDERGVYLGAVRYRTMRLLEEELRGSLPEEGETARALGGLLRAGAASVLEALATTAPAQGPGSAGFGRSRDGK